MPRRKTEDAPPRTAREAIERLMITVASNAELRARHGDIDPNEFVAIMNASQRMFAELRQAEQRILQIAGQQQKTALYIQTLLTLLGARSLLLLGLASATALTWQTLTNPEATLPKMILAAAASALLVLPLVWLIAKKG